MVKLIGFQQMSWHIIPGLSSFQINLELFLKNSQTQADPAKKSNSDKISISLEQNIYLLIQHWKLVMIGKWKRGRLGICNNSSAFDIIQMCFTCGTHVFCLNVSPVVQCILALGKGAKIDKIINFDPCITLRESSPKRLFVTPTPWSIGVCEHWTLLKHQSLAAFIHCQGAKMLSYISKGHCCPFTLVGTSTAVFLCLFVCCMCCVSCNL